MISCFTGENCGLVSLHVTQMSIKITKYGAGLNKVNTHSASELDFEKIFADKQLLNALQEYEACFQSF